MQPSNESEDMQKCLRLKACQMQLLTACARTHAHMSNIKYVQILKFKYTELYAVVICGSRLYGMLTFYISCNLWLPRFVALCVHVCTLACCKLLAWQLPLTYLCVSKSKFSTKFHALSLLRLHYAHTHTCLKVCVCVKSSFFLPLTILYYSTALLCRCCSLLRQATTYTAQCTQLHTHTLVHVDTGCLCLHVCVC